jgi:hypothetical protein
MFGAWAAGVIRAIVRALEDTGSPDLDRIADLEDSLTQEMQPGSLCPREERSCSTNSIRRESIFDTDINDDLSEETHAPSDPRFRESLKGHHNTTFEEYYTPRQETEALHDGVEYQLLSEESQEIRIY